MSESEEMMIPVWAAMALILTGTIGGSIAAYYTGFYNGSDRLAAPLESTPVCHEESHGRCALEWRDDDGSWSFQTWDARRDGSCHTDDLPDSGVFGNFAPP